jgi:hypothetical protein
MCAYIKVKKGTARILHEKDGVPLFVLVPYDKYFRPKRVSEDEGKVYLPLAVVVQIECLTTDLSSHIALLKGAFAVGSLMSEEKGCVR